MISTYQNTRGRIIPYHLKERDSRLTYDSRNSFEGKYYYLHEVEINQKQFCHLE